MNCIKSKTILLQYFALIIVLFISSAPANISVHAQPSVTINGDCNVTVVTIGNSTSSVDLRGQVCNAADDPQKALRVMYYWLDPLSTSLLLASKMEASLRTILGEKPFILPNDVYRNAKDLLDRFGTKVDAKTTAFGDYTEITIRTGAKTTDWATIRNDPLQQQVMRGLKVYDAKARFSIPDLPAYQAFVTPSGWPNSYSVMYCPHKPAVDWNAENVIFDTYLWRFAIPSDLKNYRANLASVGAWARRQNNPIIYDPEESIYRGKAIDAMLYITRFGWPRDFLIVYGNVNECGGALDFYTYPREPYLQIAVIENISMRSPIPLSELKVSQSKQSKLRYYEDDTDWSDLTLPFPPNAIQPGDKVVIPLRIDFRRGRDEIQDVANFYDKDSDSALYSAIQSAPRIKVGLQEGKGEFWKLSSAFRPGTEAKIETTYTYGPRISLVSARAGNTEIPLRSYDPNRIFMVGRFESGSCPFLYARYSDDPSPLKVGRILKYADSPEKAGIYEREFEDTLEEITIAEEEAETTILREISLESLDALGRVIARTITNNIRLELGKSWTMRPVKMAGVAKYRLKAEGHYVPFSRQVVESVLHQ